MKHLVFVGCLLVCCRLTAEPAAWEPARTWVFAVGVLKFDDPHVTSYPNQGRVDQVLIDTLIRRGVPRNQVVFIKNKQATKAAIESQLTEFLERPAEGDTLLFYYTGHGVRDYADPARPVSLVTYDTQSNWTVQSLLSNIAEHFHGSRVLLAADCCHSGALAHAAAAHPRLAWGVLSSSHSNSVSTGNWTFTQCLVNLFAGQAAADANGDGQIAFREAGRFLDVEMSFCEDQRATHAALGGFPPDLILAPSLASKQGRMGEACEARFHGGWLKARIIEVKDSKLRVDWIGRPGIERAWLDPEQLRPYRPTMFEPGTRVEIEWNGEWFPGQVLKAELGLHLVHYHGFPAADDEWAPLSRLRALP